MFPYSGDDWSWGSQIGLDRLANGFENYNGRYLGNLAAIVLTRSNLLKSFVMSATLIICVLLAKKLISSKVVSSSLILSAVLLFTPRHIARQAIVWTSGFVNYTLPVPMMLFNLLLIMRLFDGIPKYKKYEVPLAFLCAGASSLFMENYTLFGLALSLFAVLYALFRYEMVYLTHISMLLGSSLGTVIMFRNGVYGYIAGDGDTYRSFGMTVNELLKTAYGNFKYSIGVYTFSSNWLINIILVIALSALFALIFRRCVSKAKKAVGAICLSVVYVLVFYSFFANILFDGWVIALNLTDFFDFGLQTAYFVSLIVLCFIAVEDKAKRYRLLLILCSIAVLTVPLLIVTPIGGRNFFLPYLFYAVFAIILADIFLSSCSAEIQNICKPLLRLVPSVAILCGGVFVFSVFSYISLAYNSREATVEMAKAEKSDVIVIKGLPYSGFLHNANPNNELFKERFKMYYGIEQDVEIKYKKTPAYEFENIDMSFWED